MSVEHHLVRVVADPEGRALTALVEGLNVTSDMLELADPFELEVPLGPELWAALKPDSEVQVWIDETRVLTGFVDERTRHLSKSGGSTIEVHGRDKGGRLVDESAPLGTFAGLTIDDLARKMVSPWFGQVALSNARNRALLAGHVPRAVAKEPAVLSGRDIVKKVEPGDTRAGVLLHFLAEAELLGWSSADGREFIVGLPNYNQTPLWSFFVGRPGGTRFAEINVEDADYSESVAERYASITVCGSGKGSSSQYGKQVTRWTSTALDNPDAPPDGVGRDFQRPKALRLGNHKLRSADKAKQRAQREMRLRQSQGRELSLTAPGYGQAPPGRASSIFCCDTMARWEDEELDLREDFLVTRVQFVQSKTEGQTSRLALVPKGTELRCG